MYGTVSLCLVYANYNQYYVAGTGIVRIILDQILYSLLCYSIDVIKKDLSRLRVIELDYGHD